MSKIWLKLNFFQQKEVMEENELTVSAILLKYKPRVVENYLKYKKKQDKLKTRTWWILNKIFFNLNGHYVARLNYEELSKIYRLPP